MSGQHSTVGAPHLPRVTLSPAPTPPGPPGPALQTPSGIGWRRLSMLAWLHWASCPMMPSPLVCLHLPPSASMFSCSYAACGATQSSTGCITSDVLKSRADTDWCGVCHILCTSASASTPDPGPSPQDISFCWFATKPYRHLQSPWLKWCYSMTAPVLERCFAFKVTITHQCLVQTACLGRLAHLDKTLHQHCAVTVCRAACGRTGWQCTRVRACPTPSP